MTIIMSLRIEFGKDNCQTMQGGIATIDNFSERIHIRAYREGSEYFVSISNANPEGDKNGPGYCELGFYLNEKDLPQTQKFMGKSIQLRKSTE